MPNTRSAEKAVRSSEKKRLHNLFWKTEVKNAVKSVRNEAGNPDILKEQQIKLQSLLDRAVKERVIHKNKAARLKSRLMKPADATSKPTRKAKSKSN